MSEQYFQQQEIKSSSLVDFDSWSVQNFNHCQMASTHKKFYSCLNSILLDENASEEEISAARGLIKAKKLLLTQFIASVCIADDLKFAGSLWKNLDLLRKIHEGFKDDEGADSREKTYEERERELSLREREMALREREASVRALELSNMEKELELKALEN
ncbi:hypothetical protein RirG_191640 [Rhizophagus irregularis DAOM 197198w]|uniref:Uncharacterized protein n=1 Tax=Rhizophagus irregularis (strain DAOM 197198w) TaxID=1432141 RepID=A0A015IPJ7_RHIIW|nr:hypothetical protein RirG_191640 [Rhizophagus irregularis DAOM 197198w]